MCRNVAVPGSPSSVQRLAQAGLLRLSPDLEGGSVQEQAGLASGTLHVDLFA